MRCFGTFPEPRDVGGVVASNIKIVCDNGGGIKRLLIPAPGMSGRIFRVVTITETAGVYVPIWILSKACHGLIPNSGTASVLQLAQRYLIAGGLAGHTAAADYDEWNLQERPFSLYAPGTTGLPSTSVGPWIEIAAANSAATTFTVQLDMEAVS